MEESVDGVVRAAGSARCDLVEVRLDALKSLEGIERMSGIKKPVIATLMPAWEGGLYKGKETERISTLISILGYCDYVSLELRTEKRLRDRVIGEAKKKGVKVIITYHDFRKTPGTPGIKRIIKNQVAAGADVAKVAFMAGSYDDALRLMGVLSDRKTRTPLIVISMGPYGKISRFLAPLLGSYLTFTAPGKGKEAAPGQLTINRVRELIEEFGVE